MSTVNSFGARTSLTVGGRTYQMFSLPALERAGFPEIARLPFSLKILLENLLRHEDGRFVKAADVETLARWDVKSTAQKEISFAPARVLLQDFTGVPGGRRPGRDARRHRPARRRSEQGEPVAAGRAGHRPLGAGRLFRPGQRVPAQRRARVRAQQGALRVPALGPGRLRQFPRRPARHRHRASGQPRVSRARDHGGGVGGRHARVPGHAGRHRLAHDDGERARRDGMGRRRHRSRSGDARPADLDADPAGARLPPDRHDARRRDRDRPGADDHREAAQARRRRQVRRVLRRRASST